MRSIRHSPETLFESRILYEGAGVIRVRLWYDRGIGSGGAAAASLASGGVVTVLVIIRDSDADADANSYESEEADNRAYNLCMGNIRIIRQAR